MNFQEYESRAAATDLGTDIRIGVTEAKAHYVYLALGLAGEAGEVVDHIKKVVRDRGGVMTVDDRMTIKKELGDVLWYLARIANDCGLCLEDVACANIGKLADRKARGQIHGKGNNR